MCMSEARVKKGMRQAISPPVVGFAIPRARSIDISPKGYRSMVGANAHQTVSDHVYEALLNTTKTELLVQRSDFYINKLKGKKYLVIENDERPEKPRARFLIKSINEETGSIREDIYGQTVNGLYLRIELKLRQKTR